MSKHNNETVFFDKNGRCIPKNLINQVYPESRRYFLIPETEVNYNDVFNRIKKHLNYGDGLKIGEFESRSENILEKLRSDSSTKNIVNGARVPFFLPKGKIDTIGGLLSDHYLKALESSFKESNPDYDFNNFCLEDIRSTIKVVPDSRHQKLLDAMKEDTIVGYFFPCMLEYSIPAALEQLNSLPEEFLLAGGFDTCAAFIGSPNILLRTDGYPPLLWMTGIVGDKDYAGFHIEAYGYNLTFNRRPHHGNVAEYWSHALVVLG